MYNPTIQYNNKFNHITFKSLIDDFTCYDGDQTKYLFFYEINLRNSSHLIYGNTIRIDVTYNMNQLLIKGNQIHNVYKGISLSEIRELDLNKENSNNAINNDKTCVKQYIPLNNNAYNKRDGTF